MGIGKTSTEPLHLEGEEWRAVDGWPCYQVSNFGRVKSLPRIARRFSPRWGVWSNMHLREKILTPSRFHGTDRHGVKRQKPAAALVCFQTEAGARKQYFYVHALVLSAFVGPRPTGMEACHGDGDGLNNRLGNLRWDTHAENVKDSIKHGTFYPHRMKGGYRQHRSTCH